MVKRIVIAAVLVIATLVLSIAVEYVNLAGANNQDSDSNGDPNSWPMFHDNLSHTGNSKSTAPKTNHILWSSYVGDFSYSSPVISNGTVYIGSEDGNTYALNATTGNRLWNFSIAKPPGSLSPPAVAEGMVYIGSKDGVYALNASTGNKIWNYTTSKSVTTAPAVANGIVYATSSDNNVYSLNATTGEKIWFFTTIWYIQTSPAISKGIVYVVSLDFKVYALNATTGREIWRYDVNPGGISSPAVYNDVVYVGSWDHNVYALNAETGKKLWNYTTGSGVNSSPAAANGIIYVGSEDGNIYALNAETGSQIWNYTVGAYGLTSPAVAGGVVYIGAIATPSGMGCNFYALNAATGSKIWSDNRVNYNAVSSAAIASGIVYAGFMRGNVYSNIDTLFAFGSISSHAPSVSASSSTVDQGESSTLSADMNGSEQLYSYQWFSEAPNNLYYSSIQGANSSSYNFVTSTFTYPGVWSFILQVTNSSGVAVNSIETLVTVNNALTAPDTFASDSVLYQGQSFSLSSAPLWTGALPYTYQWLQKAPGSEAYTLISGATAPSYSFMTSSSTIAGNWSFKLKVTDGASTPVSVTSDPINVTINAPPTVIITPSAATLYVGQSQLFTAIPSYGSGAYTSYKWSVNGVVQSNQTSSTFNYSPISAGSYSIAAIVTDSLGVTSSVSNPSSLQTLTPPTPTPIPTPTSTATPTSTPTQTTVPTSSPSSTAITASTQTPVPSPSIPEYSSIIILLCGFIILATAALALRRKSLVSSKAF